MQCCWLFYFIFGVHCYFVVSVPNIGMQYQKEQLQQNNFDVAKSDKLNEGSEIYLNQKIESGTINSPKLDEFIHQKQNGYQDPESYPKHQVYDYDYGYQEQYYSNEPIYSPVIYRGLPEESYHTQYESHTPIIVPYYRGYEEKYNKYDYPDYGLSDYNYNIEHTIPIQYDRGIVNDGKLNYEDKYEHPLNEPVFTKFKEDSSYIDNNFKPEYIMPILTTNSPVEDFNEDFEAKVTPDSLKSVEHFDEDVFRDKATDSIENPIISKDERLTRFVELKNETTLLPNSLTNEDQLRSVAPGESITDPVGKHNIPETGTLGNNSSSTVPGFLGINESINDLPSMKPISEPLIWFRPDEKFWERVQNGETSYDKVVFVQVRATALIERHTTIFQYENGTIVKDYCEKFWEHADDPSPKEIKSKQVIEYPDGTSSIF